MTIHELAKKYYFHDSMITSVNYSANEQKLEIFMDFCHWAQEWYKQGEPELLKLRLTFSGIKDYHGITGNIDYFSILDAGIKHDKYHLFIEDDFQHKFYEYYLEPTNIDAETIGITE